MDSEPNRRDFLRVSATVSAALACSANAGASQAADDGRAAVLRELLAFNCTKHPIYRGGLANHLSMELCALFALGASAERLREFARAYGAALVPLPADGPDVDPKEWRGAVGKPLLLPGMVRMFAQQIRERGRDTVLREALAEFAPSVASELFHCLIRTAYAVQFDDDQDVAIGLAYWASKPMALGPLAAQTGSERDFAALLARVRETPALKDARLTGNSNPGRMRQAAELAGFADVVNAFAVADGGLARLASAVRDLYATTGDFTALHAVTSTHALRVLLPWFPDPERALRFQAQGLVAAYVRMGAPAIETSFASDAAPWDAIVARALPSSDDHDAKFVYSCREEERAHGSATYRYAAQRRVGGA